MVAGEDSRRHVPTDREDRWHERSDPGSPSDGDLLDHSYSPANHPVTNTSLSATRASCILRRPARRHGSLRVPASAALPCGRLDRRAGPVARPTVRAGAAHPREFRVRADVRACGWLPPQHGRVRRRPRHLRRPRRLGRELGAVATTVSVDAGPLALHRLRPPRLRSVHGASHRDHTRGARRRPLHGPRQLRRRTVRPRW
jgi:hypothetical protein